MSESSENILGSDSDVEPDEVAISKPGSSRPALFLSSSSEDASEGEEVNNTALPSTPSSSQNRELMIELEISSDEEEKEQKTGILYRLNLYA